ncbi:MAG: hypothetical protein ACXVUE_14925 [Solirubrobacteraceae bacterium]
MTPRATSYAGDRHDPVGAQPHDNTIIRRARRDARRGAGAADVFFGDPRRPLPPAVGEHLGFADRSHLTVGPLAVVALSVLGVDQQAGLRIAREPPQMRAVGDA